MVAELTLSDLPLISKQSSNILDNSEIPEHEKPFSKTIYNSNQMKKINEKVRNKAKKLTDKSKKPNKTGVIPRFYNEKIFQKKNDKHQETRSHSSDTPYKIVKASEPNTFLKENKDNDYFMDGIESFGCRNMMPSFKDQFEDLSFNNKIKPVSKNDADCSIKSMTSELALKGGWSLLDEGEDMTYGLVDKEHFTHTNMQPYYKSNGLQFNEYNAKNRDQKLELFTGSSIADTYIPKKESGPLFLPEKNRSHVLTRGMPNHTEFFESRYIPSRMKQNQKPFEEIKVTPGLNLDYNEEGKHGFHDPFRILPRSVDELRAENDPKLTYTQPIIPGQKGSKRQVHAPVMKNAPRKVIKVPWSDWYQKNGGAYRYNKIYSPIIFPTTRRPEPKQIIGTHDSVYRQLLPTDRRSKVKQTIRETYKNEGLRNPRGVTMNTSVHNSDYTLAPTSRTEQTDIRKHYVGQHGDINAGMTHYQDELQMNPRMNTIHQENYVGQHGNVNAGITHYQDELQMNPRMNTIHQENYVGQHGDINAGITHYQDELQMNPRMNTIHQENYVGQHGDINAGITNYQDELQMNPRMNTIHQEHYTNARGDVNAGITHYQDTLQMNPRMNTIHQEHYTNARGDVNAGITHYQDELQMNPKMNTIHQEHYTNTRGDINAGITHYQDKLQMNPRMNTIHQENYVGQKGLINSGMTSLPR
jgi:hypothetical protein